jgi:hypothetical protein
MSAPSGRRLQTSGRRGPAPTAAADPTVDAQVADDAALPAPPADAVARSASVSPPGPAPGTGESPLRSALSVLITLGPPLTIATALMFYFGWARSNTQARFMGLDVSLFGFSTQDYGLQSISTLYLPLLATVSLALGWLALHQRIDRALDRPSSRPALRTAGRVALGAGLLMAASAVLIATLNRNRAPLGHPAHPGGRHGHRRVRRVARRRRERPPRAAPGISAVATGAARAARRECDHARAVLGGVQVRRCRGARLRAGNRQDGARAAASHRLQRDPAWHPGAREYARSDSTQARMPARTRRATAPRDCGSWPAPAGGCSCCTTGGPPSGAP